MLLKAFAKINWSLDITGVRPDGYHLLDMVMQPVSLADEITLIPADGLFIETGGYPASAADSSNLAYRAADLLRKTFSLTKGVRIFLHKRIPMGAGLGGGSVDAAAVLFGLNRLWDLQLPPERLEELGLEIGADVPFCLRGGLTRTQGIGERITDCPCRVNYYTLIIQPCRALSTASVFSAWHASPSDVRPDTENVLRALSAGDPDLLRKSMYNVLGPVSAASRPEITGTVEKLLETGAFAAQMTGSGSAVFGVFRSRLTAEKAYRLLAPEFRSIFLCHTQTDSIRIMEE